MSAIQDEGETDWGSEEQSGITRWSTMKSKMVNRNVTVGSELKIERARWRAAAQSPGVKL